ncbi:4a-hydroxytetrahydrobiopterin dehydratase [bacterium]|nr:4a-hydroxytetrahydrobiopterin dehydratase [bacterium]
MANLPENTVRLELKNIPGWEIKNGRLYKEYIFSNFPTAIVFVNRLVNPAEDLDHHPGISINYNRVQLELYTHTTGGITKKDLELARLIDQL